MAEPRMVDHQYASVDEVVAAAPLLTPEVAAQVRALMPPADRQPARRAS